MTQKFLSHFFITILRFSSLWWCFIVYNTCTNTHNLYNYGLITAHFFIFLILWSTSLAGWYDYYPYWLWYNMQDVCTRKVSKFMIYCLCLLEREWHINKTWLADHRKPSSKDLPVCKSKNNSFSNPFYTNTKRTNRKAYTNTKRTKTRMRAHMVSTRVDSMWAPNRGKEDSNIPLK